METRSCDLLYERKYHAILCQFVVRSKYQICSLVCMMVGNHVVWKTSDVGGSIELLMSKRNILGLAKVDNDNSGITQWVEKQLDDG